MSVQNLRIAHPSQPNLFVEVVLASRHPITRRCVYTLHLRYPRIIHAEVMTHRVFNRNARSSRAVPVQTMLREVRNAPFVPWHWGANQKGMQAGADCIAKVLIPDWDDINFHGTPHRRPYDREEAWLFARDKALDVAEAFSDAGYHKQICNRLLEPFMWIDTLITATDWKNFLHLRDHKDAEPHLRDLAVLVKQAIEQATVQELRVGDWHTPYIYPDDIAWAVDQCEQHQGPSEIDLLAPVSSARCARISYAAFDGNSAHETEMQRYQMLIGGDAVHASPLEHQCQADEIVTVESSYWLDDDLLKDVSERRGLHHEPHGSLRDFIQYRKTIPNEAVHE